MIKTKSKIIAIAVMMIFGAGFAYAQAVSPESNASKATFGEITTDVDNFLDTVGYKDLELESLFLYSRFGANIPDARLDLGAAFSVGSLYFGVYYNGGIAGLTEGATRRGEYPLYDSSDTKGESYTMMKWKAREKIDPKAEYGILVGGIADMGFKFSYEDYLSIDGTWNGSTATETLEGYATPSLEAGLNLGLLSKVGLSFMIMHNRTETTAFSAMDTVTYTSTDLDNDGNYVQPDVYVKLDFGALGIDGFTLENNLRFRIYGLPKFGESAKISGVGYFTSVYDMNGSKGIGDATSETAAWDKRIYIEDVIAPSYNFSNADDESESNLIYSATVSLPITIKFIGHSYNVMHNESANKDANYDIQGYYKGSTASLGIAPTLSAGVKYQIAAPFAVQAGISAELFSITSETRKTDKVDKLSDKEEAVLAGLSLSRSGESKSSEAYFTYPKLSFGAGFTISLFDKAALDFALIYIANPTAAGTIYKAVGDGLGSGDTSIVLSLKF